MTKRTLWMYTGAVLAIALFTFGCGGDDGVDQSVHDMALAERDAALEAEMMAEAEAEAAAAAQAAAEAQAEAAAAAQAAAEAQAEAAAAAQAQAEADAAAEAAAADAAAADAAAAEAARMAAEAAAAAAAAAELEAVQTAAAAAAMAAKTASYAAAADAMAAMTATANIASLQTGGMSTEMADDAQDAADNAMAAYMAAMAASDAAAAAMTVEEATEAKVMAEAAQADAEMYAMTAMESSAGAAMAAMSELMIDGKDKNVGDSMLNAEDGKLTKDGAVTGFQSAISRVTEDVAGQHYIQGDEEYRQAVAAGEIDIGMTVDASDDAARLMIITKYQGEKDVWVFADHADDNNLVGLLDENVEGDGQILADLDTDAEGEQNATVKSIGMYYEAVNTAAPAGADAPDVADFPGASTGAGNLDAYDLVTVDGATVDGEEVEKAEGVEIFELTGMVTDDGSGSPGVVTRYARIQNTKEGDDGPVTYYQPVDIISEVSRTGRNDLRPVTATIPMAVDYEHLHFGLWANLKAVDSGDATNPADLGISFLQSIGDGITEKLGIGSATFNGDWVAAVQRPHADGEGEIVLADGKARLTANFNTDVFTGQLDTLVTLLGSLSGNGFEGTIAAVGADNAYGLTAGVDFEGMFEGGIYGSDGEEAGGIFDFTSANGGAFRGAFGGHRNGKP